MGILVPAARPLLRPDSTQRVLRRPDLRGLIKPRLSGAPLAATERDADELIIHRSWRAYDPMRPDEVRYFMYEYSQRMPGEEEWVKLIKAVRLIRLTRVPRYLRQGGHQAGANMVFEQQRDVMAALREAQVLFLSIMAKSPKLPLVFGYGVQALGASEEEAQQLADEAYAVLDYQLSGTYQQLRYQPLTVVEGELLARYQTEWNHLAMGRGRPMPTGSSLGSSSLLDGNRNDPESTNNQLESFLRGMGNRSFVLSMVTAPISPVEMTSAFRNLAQKLSAVRSDQQGQRGFSAGIAMPLGMGSSIGDSHGNSHSVGTSTGVGATDSTSKGIADGLSSSMAHGLSQSEANGVSQSQAHGVSQSLTAGESLGTSQSQALGLSHQAGVSQSQGLSASDSLSAGQSMSHGLSASQSESQSLGTSQSHALGQSATSTDSLGQSVSVGSSHGLSDTRSLSDGLSTSVGQSLADSHSAGSSWANSAGKSLTGSVTHTDGTSHGSSSNTSQSLSAGNNLSQSLNQSFGASTTQGSSIGLLGSSGSGSASTSQTNAGGTGAGNSYGLSQTQGGGLSVGISQSQAQGLSQGLNLGESYGGNLGQSLTASNSVGTGHSVTAGHSLGSSDSQTASQGASRGQSMARGLSDSFTNGVSQGVGSSLSDGQSLTSGDSLTRGTSEGQSLGTGASRGVGTSQTATEGQSQGRSMSHGVGTSQTATLGQSQTATTGVSQTSTDAASKTASTGTGQSLSQQNALSDAYLVALSRTASQTTSLGAVPNLGASWSKATFDEAKRVIGDMLQAQMARYWEGTQSGAYFYQMFLQCEDRETLVGAAGLLKSAFWGLDSAGPVVQPFHVITEFPSDAERDELLTHARALTMYRKREPVTELIEPYQYSSYLTPTEASAVTHPPVSEGLGLMAQFDSMPVLSMPSDRADREIYLGHLVNGERGEVSDWRYGIDLADLTHALIAGVTGSGKTTTLMRFLREAVNVRRTVVTPPTQADPVVRTREIPAGILGLDWMRNMRDLAQVVEPDRFRFFSVAKPELGAFRWNVLALPDERMNPDEWLDSQVDNFTGSMNLGEFGRSLIQEFLGELYSANRLEEYVLRPEVVDPDSGAVLRPAEVLPAVPRASLPPSAIQLGPTGVETANVYTHGALSRLVDISHFATLVAARVEQLADPNMARLYGTAMRDRIQSLWRRVQYYAPGGQYSQMLACDPALDQHTTLGVQDVIDPEKGLVTIIETDGLDLANRRLILGSVMLAVYRFGMHHGAGVFDQGGKGPGTFVVLEESHELLGERGADEDGFSAATRTALYESIARMSRALGMRIVYVAQNPDALPEAITSNVSTVFIHRVYAPEDRARVFSMLNWSNMIGQQIREHRYLGEMPVGYCIVRLNAKTDWLQSAPVQILADPVGFAPVPDHALRELAARRK